MSPEQRYKFFKLYGIDYVKLGDEGAYEYGWYFAADVPQTLDSVIFYKFKVR